jgi:membrane dipeptidase
MKYTSYLVVGLFFFILTSLTSSEKISIAKKIHEDVLTLDTHTDTPLNLMQPGFRFNQRHTAKEAKVDLPKMEEGGLDAVFFAVFTNQMPRNKEHTENSYRRAHLIIDSINSMVKSNSGKLSLAYNSSDASKIVSEGKHAIYIGMENGFPIGKDLSRVEEFYNRGVRYITLAHSSNNDICDSSTDKEGAEHNGLSSFGKEVVHEMNRLGMLVDVSHISDKAFYDVLETSKAPVFASHSSVRSLCGHPRNLSDDMIKELAAHGGVIQICILGAYIVPQDTTSQNYILKKQLRKKYNGYLFKNDEERKQAWAEWAKINREHPQVLPSITDVVDHIDYVVELVGIDYVGIGSDFDGGGELSDCRDVSQFPGITEELYKRGYSQEDIAKIWGGNFFRVFSEAEQLVGK